MFMKDGDGCARTRIFAAQMNRSISWPGNKMRGNNNSANNTDVDVAAKMPLVSRVARAHAQVQGRTHACTKSLLAAQPL